MQTTVHSSHQQIRVIEVWLWYSTVFEYPPPCYIPSSLLYFSPLSSLFVSILYYTCYDAFFVIFREYQVVVVPSLHIVNGAQSRVYCRVCQQQYTYNTPPPSVYRIMLRCSSCCCCFALLLMIQYMTRLLRR